MTNEINDNGIVTDSYETTYQGLVTAFKNIYGVDINLDQSTPDGQLIGIAAQAKQDTLELATALYNIFNPETAVGIAQDNLYKLVGLRRKASQFSFVEVTVTTTGSCTLQGLDADAENVNGTGYTVSDTYGNNWILLNTAYINQAGTYNLDFRAEKQGAVQVLPNTVTNMVTIVENVSNVNNPAVQYITGQTEETDVEFRVRFNKSRALSSVGLNDGLLARLLNVNLVTGAFVYNNRTNTTDSTGTAAHTIWCIVEGGTNADIANTIYSNITDGCGMRGTVTYDINTAGGLVETVRFDRPSYQSLEVTFSLISKSGATVDQDALKTYIVENLKTGVYTSVDTLQITNLIQQYDNNLIPYDLTISGDGGTTQEEFLLPQGYNYKFTLATSDITIANVNYI